MKIELIQKGNAFMIRRRLWGFIPLWLNPFTSCGSWGVFHSLNETWQLFPDAFCKLDKKRASEEFERLERAARIAREIAASRRAFRKAKEEIVAVIEV